MRRMMRPAFLVLGVSALLAGCGGKEGGAKDDLGEAGFELTTEDFFRAGTSGDQAVVARFLDGGFDLETRNAAGDSVLHAAAAAGAEKMLPFLLDRGMSVDLPGAAGRSPLTAAVMAGQAGCVRYLLRNGADPESRDDDDYKPLMRAVEADQVGAVEELAPYVRQDLDTALLMAALLGKPEMIDALTNYGASVYARTDDGRTALMVAAEQGHLGAARMLVAIGANRYALDPKGRIAAEIAGAAGHQELATELAEVPAGNEFGLAEPVWLAEDLPTDAASPDRPTGPDTVDGVPAAGDGVAAVVEGGSGAGETAGEGGAGTGAGAGPLGEEAGQMPWNRPQPGEGAAALGGLIDGAGSEPAPAGGGRGPVSIEGATVSRKTQDQGAVEPAIVMRRYRQPALPLQVESATPGRARVRLLSGEPREIEIEEGSVVPGTRLKVVRIERRIDHSKLHDGRSMDVSMVEVEDTGSGRRRQLVAGLTATAHDPLALVEDQATGQRYMVEAGDRFQSEGGEEYAVIDVRPNQVVLEHLGSGETLTLPLRGPRG